jgi:hypothetical protein
LFEREERFSVLEKDLPKVQSFIADNIRA